MERYYMFEDHKKPSPIVLIVGLAVTITSTYFFAQQAWFGDSRPNSVTGILGNTQFCLYADG